MLYANRCFHATKHQKIDKKENNKNKKKHKFETSVHFVCHIKDKIKMLQKYV